MGEGHSRGRASNSTLGLSAESSELKNRQKRYVKQKNTEIRGLGHLPEERLGLKMA